MSTPNLQQKKARSKIPTGAEITEQMGKEAPETFYSAAHSQTEKIYQRAKMGYRNTPEEDAEEMWFDRIQTIDGQHIVQRNIYCMYRERGLDGVEYITIHEEMTSVTQLGNAESHHKTHNISEHDEPDINFVMVPGQGDRIRRKGEQVVRHNLKHDIRFTDENIEECFKRVLTPLRLRLYVKDYGERPYGPIPIKIWKEYSWEEILKYCKTGKTRETLEEEAVETLRRLSPTNKLKALELLLSAVGGVEGLTEALKTGKATTTTTTVSASAGSTQTQPEGDKIEDVAKQEKAEAEAEIQQDEDSEQEADVPTQDEVDESIKETKVKRRPRAL